MSNTSKLGLPLVAANQAQKHVTVNETFEKLDALTQATVKSTALSAPPTGVVGECYLVGNSATGDWLGKDLNITQYLNGSWYFHSPKMGWKVWDELTAQEYLFDGTAWVSARDTPLASSPSGATMGFYILEENLTVSGATTDTSIDIPNGAIVFNVSMRVTTTITGATSFSLGVAGNTSQFGSGLSVASGSTNLGVISPTAFYAAAPIRVTSSGGSFTAGAVRIAIHYYLPSAPES
jgi:hypothetical protein